MAHDGKKKEGSARRNKGSGSDWRENTTMYAHRHLRAGPRFVCYQPRRRSVDRERASDRKAEDENSRSVEVLLSFLCVLDMCVYLRARAPTRPKNTQKTPRTCFGRVVASVMRFAALIFFPTPPEHKSTEVLRHLTFETALFFFQTLFEPTMAFPVFAATKEKNESAFLTFVSLLLVLLLDGVFFF